MDSILRSLFKNFSPATVLLMVIYKGGDWLFEEIGFVEVNYITVQYSCVLGGGVRPLLYSIIFLETEDQVFGL